MYRAICFALLLTGCASSRTTYTQDGRQGYAIDCSGSARTWDMCLSKAGDLCGTRGYDVLDRSGDTGAVAAGYYAGSVITRSMVIACKR